MTELSRVISALAVAQSAVIASQWCPEGLAPLLVGEYVFDGGQVPSLINHANPPVLPTLIGTPTFNAHSMSLAGSTQGVDTGVLPTEADQTFLMVLKTPTAGGCLYGGGDTGGNATGFFYGIHGSVFGFYNGRAGVGPMIAEVAAVAGGNFFTVIGWGSVGGPGNIQTASAGALNAQVTGTESGLRAGALTIKVGGANFGSPAFEVAYAGRIPAILTAAQRLAWHLAVKSALTTAGLSVA